jgi:hypothetical protein
MGGQFETGDTLSKLQHHNISPETLLKSLPSAD